MAKQMLSASQVLKNDARFIFRIPRVVAYNRVESEPRLQDFTRSLKAEIRDPLWMLTRQWQFGEFRGEDAASPVTARIAYQHKTIDRVAFQTGDDFGYNPADMPLEAAVERERIPLTVREGSDGSIFSDVLFAIRLGKQFLKQLVTFTTPCNKNRHIASRLMHWCIYSKSGESSQIV